MAVTQGHSKKIPHDWFTYYYLHKNADEVGAALQALAKKGGLQKRTAQPPLLGFFSVLFARHPDKADAWVQTPGLTKKERIPLILAMWYAGLNKQAIERARIDAWQEDVIADLSNDAPILMTMDVTKVPQLDMLWGGFMASGNVRYVKRVIDILASIDEVAPDRLTAMLINRSAKWSLKTNALQHELVRRLCEEEIETREGEVKDTLISIVRNVTVPEHVLPTRVGDFSAYLILTGDTNFFGHWKEVIKSANPAIPGTETGRTIAKKDALLMPIVFSGFALDKLLNAHVSYNVNIYKPNGEVHFSATELIAIKRRFPLRFKSQLVKDGPRIKFKADDPLGRYKAVVDFRDHIAAKSLTLSAFIEVVE